MRNQSSIPTNYHSFRFSPVHSLQRLLLILLSVALLLQGCRPPEDDHEHSHHHDHESHHDEEAFARGPHHGRLLTDGTFSLELTIFEQGVEPQFRLYGYDREHPILPDQFSATVTLHRLQGDPEVFAFNPVGEFLTSDQIVREPHSFAVTVEATYGSDKHHWTFESFEGRTVIPVDVAAQSGIELEEAAPHTLSKTVRVRGKIIPSEDRIAHIVPRFAGVVRKGLKHIGDTVESGELVAVIESNQTLQPFEVRSQIGGSIINGHVVVGEFVPENHWIYIVADISTVWADFFVPLRDAEQVGLGQDVAISAVTGDASATARLSYRAPYADERSQTVLVRAEVKNPSQTLMPGMFVTGDITVQSWTAPVTVKRSAIQKFRDWDVVFVHREGTFEVQPVELGASSGSVVEILSGLKAGQSYVAKNSFLLKADILKSGATHDH